MHGHGRRRTRADAGAAAIAQRRVHFGLGHAADGGAELDGARLALFAAGAAHHTVVGEAVVADDGLQLPGRLMLVSTQGTARALFQAGAAEGTLAVLKIDLGESAASGDEQTLGTGTHALAAAVAAIDEQPLFQRPGRTHCTPLTAYVAAEELRPSDRCLHHAAPQVKRFVAICVQTLWL